IIREYIPTELFEEVAHLTFASTAARDPKAFRKGFIPPFVCQSEMTTPGASVITFDRYCPLQMIVTTHPTIGGHSSMMTLGSLKRIFGKSISIRADCTGRPNSPGISERRSKPSSIGENTPVAKPVKKADSSKVAN
ncbi:MAG: hypothetical protein H7301_01575, partial [Cryobacterium sp.]|nr:hypothetical protein [Oligoflexia bacterium]